MHSLMLSEHHPQSRRIWRAAQRTALALSCSFVSLGGVIALAQSDTIPSANRRDHVYDPNREILYITTSAGELERFHLPSRTMLAPLEVGQSLNGLDLTPDGNALYIAENTPGNASNTVYNIDLTTGNITAMPFVQDSQQEAGVWDICIASNDSAFITTRYAGAGKVPLRQLHLDDGTFEIRRDAPRPGGFVTQDAGIVRSADYGTLFFSEWRLSSGPIYRYESDSDTFADSVNTSFSTTSPISALSRNGAFIAHELSGSISIRNADQIEIASLSGFDGGVIFSPVDDILWVGDQNRDEIVAFDTATWTEQFRVDAGIDLQPSFAMGNGVMSITDDGRTMFVSVDAGVQVITLVPPMELEITPRVLQSGSMGQLEITQGKPHTDTYIVYSMHRGSTYVPALDIELDLHQPRLLGHAIRSDSSGRLSKQFTVPSLRPKRVFVYLQAAQSQLKSNVFEVEVKR